MSAYLIGRIVERGSVLQGHCLRAPRRLVRPSKRPYDRPLSGGHILGLAVERLAGLRAQPRGARTAWWR